MAVDISDPVTTRIQEMKMLLADRIPRFKLGPVVLARLSLFDYDFEKISLLSLRNQLESRGRQRENSL